MFSFALSDPFADKGVHTSALMRHQNRSLSLETKQKQGKQDFSPFLPLGTPKDRED